METPAEYHVTPPLLLGEPAALFADVRRKYRAGLPGTLQAAKWFRLEDVLDHAAALIARLEKTEYELEVEKAKTALLWPVVTKQNFAHDAK